jgi:hypothetical protein
LVEKIYDHPPPGYEDADGRVWHLKKSLYGLKQAPREWIAKFTAVLHAAGFRQSIIEPTLFILDKDGEILYMLVFVDDILLGSKSRTLIRYAKDVLLAEFDMTDLGPATKYLGWHVTRDRTAGKLWLSLEPRIQKAIRSFQLHGLRATTTPLPTDWQAWYPHETDLKNPRRQPEATSKDKYSELLNEAQHTLYRQGVGFINYAACALRPDVAYAAGQLSQILHVPRGRHLLAMYHCLKYLAGTADLALCFDQRQAH